ncbi:MAG: helix-turn-helix transcriptional regulator [Lachnospiraceae bacterium]|nr:helix-turn-helix transcriptional regulator [Lachnospiraceae bacterium]
MQESTNEPITLNNHFALQVLPSIRQFPYKQEEILLSQIRSCDPHEISETLNNLLGYVIFPDKSNLTDSKNRVREITSVLLRFLIETGADDQTLCQFKKDGQKILFHNLSFDELCGRLQQITDSFMQYIQTSGPLSSSQAAVCQARGYIARHYASRLTLKEVADYVHLNPAYFSSLFKKTYGMSFKEFLNRIRIEKSRQLLTETNYDIIDIAIIAGFEDQSYFTKLFRQYYGLPPRQYRKKLFR